MLTIKERDGLTINTPDAGEKTLFLDTDSKLKTKDQSGVIEEVAIVSANTAKVYKARIAVTGTNTPISEVVIANTLGSPVVWTRPSPGRYFAQNSAFNYNKQIIKIENTTYSPDYVNVRFNDMPDNSTIDLANYVLNVDFDGGVVFYEQTDYTPGVYFYITIEVYP